MNWINLYGLVFMLIILIPNILFGIKQKEGFQNVWRNRVIEILEQIGRYGCFVFMILILPGSGFGFSSDESFALYLIINAVLVVLYCLIWAICFKKNSMFRALALSVIPSLVFLISGALSHDLPLLIAAVIFAPCHIIISCQNARLRSRR